MKHCSLRFTSCKPLRTNIPSPSTSLIWSRQQLCMRAIRVWCNKYLATPRPAQSLIFSEINSCFYPFVAGGHVCCTVARNCAMSCGVLYFLPCTVKLYGGKGENFDTSKAAKWKGKGDMLKLITGTQAQPRCSVAMSSNPWWPGALDGGFECEAVVVPSAYTGNLIAAKTLVQQLNEVHCPAQLWVTPQAVNQRLAHDGSDRAQVKMLAVLVCLRVHHKLCSSGCF